MLDLMIHDIDLILSIVRSPVVSVDAIGSSVFSKEIDIANARLRFANGCVANATASRVSLKTERRLRLFQDDAYVSVDLHQKVLTVIRKGAGMTADGMPQVAIEESSYDQGDALKAEIEAFLAAAAAGAAPAVTGEDGLLGAAHRGQHHRAGGRLDAPVRLRRGLHGHPVHEVAGVGKTGGGQTRMLGVVQLHPMSHGLVEFGRHRRVAHAEAPHLRRGEVLTAAIDHGDLTLFGLAQPPLAGEFLQDSRSFTVRIGPGQREPGPQSKSAPQQKQDEDAVPQGAARGVAADRWVGNFDTGHVGGA